MKNEIKEPDRMVRQVRGLCNVMRNFRRIEREQALCLRAVMLHKHRKYGYHSKVTWRDKLAAEVLARRRELGWFGVIYFSFLSGAIIILSIALICNR